MTTFTTGGSAVTFTTSGSAVSFAVTDATNAFTTSAVLTPGAHASTHGAGGADPITTLGTVTTTLGTVTTLVATTATINAGTAAGLVHTGQSIFAAGSAAGPSIAPTGDTNTGIYFPAADQVGIATAGTARVVVTDTGVGIGQTTPAGALHVERNGSGANIRNIRNSTDAVGPSIALMKRRGTDASPTIVSDNDVCGALNFHAYDGDSDNQIAGIQAEVDGATANNDTPGRLKFSTSADGAAVVTEAMRINNAQELLIGYTADNGAYKLQVNSQIFATSATIATSDGRYKENVETLGGGWDMVKALRPVAFNWKPQAPVIDGDGEIVREAHNFPDGRQVGFIAQEVQAALADHPWVGNLVKENHRPEVVAGDGTVAPAETFYGIAEGNLIAVLTSALQEAMTRIEALEARVAALESA